MHQCAIIVLSALVALASAQKSCVGFTDSAKDFTSVSYRQKGRRGQLTNVVTEAEVEWQPQNMLSDSACEVTATKLQMRPTSGPASSEWTTVTEKQAFRSVVAKWTVDVKPCLGYEFQIKLDSGETLLLPSTLGPATDDEVLNSRYEPEPPTDLSFDLGAQSVSMTWSASDCATAYDVNWKPIGTSDYKWVTIEAPNALSTTFNDLTPCSKYEVAVTALLGDAAGRDNVKVFSTKPRLDVAKNMDPLIMPTLDSVTVSWEAISDISCIDSYLVTVCPKADPGCGNTQTVQRPTGIPTITYTAEGLDACTDYVVGVQPVFPETEIEGRTWEFRTQSPSADSQSLSEVDVKQVTTASMLVSWSALKCATGYKVYQRNALDEEWKLVADTTEVEITIQDITPCTSYDFAVTAKIGDDETPKQTKEGVVSALNKEDPFEAPNLAVNNGDTSAELSWDHANCIDAYTVRVCKPSNEDCRDMSVDPSGSVVVNTIEDLQPCTRYQVEIIPVLKNSQALFTARPHDFTTTNGTPQPPSNFKVELAGTKVSLSWDAAACSTGYKLYHKAGENADPTPVETIELSEEYEDPTPCATYFYAVATVVAEQESEPTEWQSLSIPPRADAPLLKILNNEQDNITLRLDQSPINEKCEVEEYLLRYTPNYLDVPMKDITLRAEDYPSGDLTLSYPGATGENSVVEGRVNYAGSDVTSAKVSNTPARKKGLIVEPVSDSVTVVPIVIGVIVVIVIIIIVAIVIVKRRSATRAYDTEKGHATAGENGKKEETQRLNENAGNA